MGNPTNEATQLAKQGVSVAVEVLEFLASSDEGKALITNIARIVTNLHGALANELGEDAATTIIASMMRLR